MLFKAILILAGVAYLLESWGPWLLTKFFPQMILNPAPEIDKRPKHSAARQDAHVDSAMQEVADVSKVNMAKTPAQRSADSLVSSASPADTLAHADLDQNFDYADFRPAAREAAPAVQVVQGIPDVFDEETTSAHA